MSSLFRANAGSQIHPGQQLGIPACVAMTNRGGCRTAASSAVFMLYGQGSRFLLGRKASDYARRLQAAMNASKMRR